MDPNIKLLADEIHKRFDDLGLKWEQRLLDSKLRLGARVDDQEKRHQARLDDLETQHGERLVLVERMMAYHDDRLGRLEGTGLVFDNWCPRIKATIDDIKLEMHKLARAWEYPAPERPAAGRGILPLPESAMERLPAPNYYADGPNGHRLPPHNRDDGFGSVFTIPHHPVKGAYSPPLPPPTPPPGLGHARWGSHPFGAGSTGKLPKLQFPSFDGDNPKLWMFRCEDYFDLYQVEPQLWVRVATMHFTGAAARWLMSVESRLRMASWSQFGQLLLERFGHDQQEQLIRQLFRISQTGNVPDYIDKFVELIDQLIAYGHKNDPLYYTQRFIEGLRPNLRAAVHIQRPKDLDSACTLALLQEEVAEPPRREYRRPDLVFRLNLHRPVLHHRAQTKTKSPDPGRSVTDKFSALCAYRRARGLCDRCAEKWSLGHRCAPAIQLHAVQEVLELFTVEESSDGAEQQPSDGDMVSTEQIFVALSQEAVSGSLGARTMKLEGSILSHQLLVLLDSGSSNTFISSRLATVLDEAVLVQVCQLAMQDQLDLVQQSVPPAVSALLSEFAHVFELVSGLPPKRHCDHVIPLKKDGSWHPVVDYRYLNALTVRGKFPIPMFDEMMDELAGSSWFSTLDLNSGFHQIRLKAGEEPKTAFQTHFGHFEFKVMSFGLCGAPGTFQGAMNQELRGASGSPSSSFQSLGTRQVTGQNDEIQEGISTDSGKISAISEWPVPANSKELRSFLGLAGYYRKFVRHFAIVSKPLTELLKKNSLFVWTADHQSAFDTLKSALCSAPYKVIYKPGPTNRVADALSRRAHPEVQVFAVSNADPVWVSAIIKGYDSDPEAQALITKLAVSPDAVPNFSLASSLLRHKHRPLGGHSGFPVTYRRIKQLFSWKGMKNDVKLFVAACQAKPDCSKMPGLVLPLPVPPSAWQIISMDFVEGLPRSSGHDCILVVVDKFTKYAHFLALAHPFNAARVAKVFFDQVYRLHGLPESIVSDKDRVFTSLFWQELFRLAGVALRMSSSYHPQSDCQTECVNQCMETFLRCYVHACPAKWMDWLSLAEYWYNTSLHSALGTSPFEALYGRPPHSLGLVPADLCPVPDLSQWLQEKEVMNHLKVGPTPKGGVN
ncbi:hypothetical protein U9M48_041833 [Paspalum notatum var. saurae]|uniref:Integrase catalytic domain-containing protein n=1 Tax=Paspalum notatum var. saurae TaxID=547442 RepID=A0AAQ3XGZ4_PASNO